MLKTLILTTFLTFALGLGFSPLGLQTAHSAPGIKGPLASSTLQGKRCEKCKRGKDGKMVCEPVPCP